MWTTLKEDMPELVQFKAFGVVVHVESGVMCVYKEGMRKKTA